MGKGLLFLDCFGLQLLILEMNYVLRKKGIPQSLKSKILNAFTTDVFFILNAINYR